MLFLIPMILLVSAATVVIAGYCTNPGVIDLFCTSDDITRADCCPTLAVDGGYNSVDNNFPDSQGDCQDNYFFGDTTNLPDKCSNVCCLSDLGECSVTMKGLCQLDQGIVLQADSCENVPQCEKGCCCYESEGIKWSEIVTESYCDNYVENTFDLTIKDASACSEFCESIFVDPEDPDPEDPDPEDPDPEDPDPETLPPCPDSDSAISVKCSCGGVGGQECDVGHYCCNQNICMAHECDTGCILPMPCGTYNPETGCPLFHMCLPTGLYDPDCTQELSCNVQPEICDDNIDNDLDGMFDCSDIDCNGVKCSDDDITACEGKGYYDFYNNNYRCCFGGPKDCDGDSDAIPDTCGNCDCNTIPEEPILSDIILTQGEKEVTLEWVHNCPVDFYVFRCSGECTDKSAFSLIAGPVSDNEFTDSDIEAESRYCYYVEASYEAIDSTESEIKCVNTGDEICMNIASEEFCLDEDGGLEGRKVVRATCENNVLTTIMNCNINDPNTVCMGPYSDGKTKCTQQSPCESCGSPFNMYSDYEKSRCLFYDAGGQVEIGCMENPSCYYDYSLTTIDKFKSCADVNFCFDYKSRFACEGQAAPGVSDSNNKCLKRDCEWHTFNDEFGMGQGVCLETVDYYMSCERCNQASYNDVFGSCNAEKCSLFGDCYLRSSDGMCVPGTTISCDEYNDISSCTGGSDLVVNVIYDNNVRISGDNSITVPSRDDLGFGVCRWNSTRSSCFKDADGNFLRDSPPPTDKVPPQTRILTQKKASMMNISFIAIDPATGGGTSSGVKASFFCKSDSANTPCYPDEYNVQDGNGHKWINLGGGGGTHYIYYYSEDYANNLEVVKVQEIDIDMTAPVITITPYTVLNYAENTNSKITFHVETDEQAYCTDHFEDGSVSQIQNELNTNWITSYGGLSDGFYEYKVVCTDLVGNTATEIVTVKVEADMRVYEPEPFGPLNLSTFFISVKTPGASTAQCKWDTEVRDYNDMRHDFSAEEVSLGGSSYFFHTSEFSTDTSGKYTLDVKCSVDGDISDDEIHFVYDVLRPETLLLASPSGIPFDITRWYTQQGVTEKVFLGCNDTPENGFGCNKTLYCTSDSGVCTPNIVSSLDTPVDIPEDATDGIWLCYVSKENIVNNMGGLYEMFNGEYRRCHEIKYDTLPPVLVRVDDFWQNRDTDNPFQTEDSPYLVRGVVSDPDGGLPNNVVKITVTGVTSGTTEEYTNIPANNEFEKYIDLELGLNMIEITVTDRSGSQSAPGSYVFYILRQEFTGEMIKLISPQNGVSVEKTFDFTIWTFKEADCRYSFNNLGFDSSIPMSYYLEGSDHMHSKQDMELQSVAEAENPIYVKCKLESGFMFEKELALSWDNTNPEIEDVYIDPSNGKTPPTVVEFPLETTMYAETDDYARCKYSSNKSTGYASETMNVFDGYYSKTFSRSSSKLFSDLEDETGHTYYIVCENRAGLLSTQTEFSFYVNTSQYTGITFVSPAKIGSNTSIRFEIRTTRQVTNCVVTPDSDDESEIPLAKESSYVYKSASITLGEGEYRYNIECDGADGKVYDYYDFAIDTSPPSKPIIDDGNISPYLNKLSASWESEDNISKVDRYIYAIGTYSNPIAIKNWTETDDDVVTVRKLNLSFGSKYYWSVKAINELDLESEVGRSSGVLVYQDPEENDTNHTDPTKPLPNHCMNKVMDENETGVDCGGECAPCKAGSGCLINSDCISLNCLSGICQNATCSDGIKNQGESDTDCGGPCEKCAENKSCQRDSDCLTEYCKLGICTEPTCDDGAKNGDEEGIDCGGSCPEECTIVNESEICYVYTPDGEKKLDSDCDGMDDEWEQLYGLKAYVDDADADDDKDGFSNLEEYLNGTDPTTPDKKGKSIWFWLLIALLIIAVLVPGSYFGYIEYTKISGKRIDWVEHIINNIKNSGIYRQIYASAYPVLNKLFPGRFRKPGTESYGTQQAAWQQQRKGYPSQGRQAGNYSVYKPGSGQQLKGGPNGPNQQANSQAGPAIDTSVPTKELIDTIRKRRQEKKKQERDNLMSSFDEGASGTQPKQRAYQKAQKAGSEKPQKQQSQSPAESRKELAQKKEDLLKKVNDAFSEKKPGKGAGKGQKKKVVNLAQ
ncbi:hypothetical protein JXB31_01280 [Candidatus Woesearchaeota archaeon]|nr:hypothetical protein [Candidatus Woesearchaeota archaeon]